MAISRRSFIKNTAVGLCAAGAALLTRTKPAFASDTPVSEDDPTALALGYKHDKAKVDAGKFPRVKDASSAKANCGNCILFQGEGREIAGQTGKWGNCGLFPGKVVAAEGWCNSYAPKPGA